MMAQKSYLGEDIKIKVQAKSIDGMSLADYEWVAHLWTNSHRVVEVLKSDCIPMDDGSYVIMLDTTQVGVGTLKLKIVAELPDGDFEDGYKTTIGMATLTQIVKSNGM